MNSTKAITKRLFIYHIHEYECWLSDMEESGWRLYEIKSRKQLIFKNDNARNKKFIILVTHHGNKVYMQKLEAHIKTSYKHTKFYIPTISGDIIILYRLQIEQTEYEKLIKVRNSVLLHCLFQKIGVPAFLSVLLMINMFLGFNYIKLITFCVILILTTYYVLCAIKIKRS